MSKALVKMALSVGVFVVLAGAPPAAQAANCLGVTGTQYRQCDFKHDSGFSGSYCTRFLQASDPNVFILKFPGGTELVCACEATGSFTAPNFAAGKDFLCFPNIATVNDVASGKVVGQKIKKGQYVDGFAPFHTWVFECGPDPTCP